MLEPFTTTLTANFSMDNGGPWTEIRRNTTKKDTKIAYLNVTHSELFGNCDRQCEIGDAELLRQFVVSSSTLPTISENVPRYLRERKECFKISRKCPSENPWQQFEPFSPDPFTSIGLDMTDLNVDIIISRGCMKQIMWSFDKALNSRYLEDFEFRIKVLPCGTVFVEETGGWSPVASYGHAFEDAMTICRPEYKEDNYFYRCLKYNLGGLRILLNAEIDCCLSADNE